MVSHRFTLENLTFNLQLNLNRMKLAIFYKLYPTEVKITHTFQARINDHKHKTEILANGDTSTKHNRA